MSNGYAEEMRRLADLYSQQSVQFLGVHCDPGVDTDDASRHASEYGLKFPIVLDPDQRLAEQVGATITPEVVVLDSAGHVTYRGRIDDRYGPKGQRRQTAVSHDLKEAIDAMLAGKAPKVAETDAFGCPMPAAGVDIDGDPIVYTKHIAPILWSRCAGCHRPGEVGPFSLLTYQDAAKRADFIRDVTSQGRMPPWKPREGFGAFHDTQRLSRKELALLAAWANAGAPEGDPSLLPEPTESSDGWQLGTPDVVLTMPEPFTVPAGQDVYRAFVLPFPIDQNAGIAGFELRPGNRRVVHHARVYVDTQRVCREREGHDSDPGFASPGGNDIPGRTLGVWIPGVTPRMPPEGVGMVVKKGSDLVLLVHYHGTGKEETDQTSVGLYFSKTRITRTQYNVPMVSLKLDIPPNDANHTVTLRATMPADAHAYSVLPHGHFLMREIKAWAVLPDASIERLIWIDDWDFNWQGQYHYAEPVALPKGTEIHVVARYDNSDANPFNPNRPPKRVRYGLASTDEMLGCHVQFLVDNPEDEPIVRKKWMKAE